MSESEIKPGDSVLCPGGVGEAVLLSRGVQLDMREPFDPYLCEVRLKKKTANPIRYFPCWELTKVTFSNIVDENADYQE